MANLKNWVPCIQGKHVIVLVSAQPRPCRTKACNANYNKKYKTTMKIMNAFWGGLWVYSYQYIV